MSKKQKRFTQKDFLVFKKWCEYYIGLFGVNYVKVNIFFGECENEYRIAENAYNHTNSDITLNTTYNCEPPANLRKTALHEVMHTVISPVYMAGTERYIRPDDIENADERVTSVLTEVFADIEKKLEEKAESKQKRKGKKCRTR